MKEWLASLLTSKDASLATILACVIALNILLTGLKKSLGWIKDKTATTLDDKAYDAVTKVLGVGEKVVEFLSANSTALPPVAKQTVESGEVEQKK
jgi:hypothetical protein